MKHKRSIAVLLTAAALCCPFSDVPVLSGIQAAPIIASAASPKVSGYQNYEFSTESEDHSYTLYYLVKDSSAKTAAVFGCYTKRDNVCITIPEKVKFRGVEYTVTEIGVSAFSKQTNIVNVTLPKTITKVGKGAFSQCTNLISVYATMANMYTSSYAMREIATRAFWKCEKLTSVSFLKDVTKIGDSAFEGCTGLTTVYAMNLVSMGAKAFESCTSLNEVRLGGSSLTEIPEGAFRFSGAYDYDIAMTVELPETVRTIGNQAFYNVIRLKKINLSHVTSIGESAFEDCHRLKTVLTCDNLAYIGSHAFYGCDPMTYFVCKNPYVWIGTEALGYAHQRNYTGKKTNFTLWGTTNSSYVNRYASNYGFPYKLTKDAAAEAVAKFQDYTWSCGNDSDMFADSGNRYFCLPGHRPYASSIIDRKWDGSCYGMAAVSALTYNGYITVDQFAPGCSKISDIGVNSSDYTKSFVNTVWSDNTNQPDYKLSRSGVNARFTDADDEMLQYIEYITYGEEIATAAVFNTFNHAYVCLGLEYKENASDQHQNAQWNDMQARILLYNVNNDAFLPIDCMYLNFDTGKWRMGWLDAGIAYPSFFDSDKNSNFGFELYCSPDTTVSKYVAQEGKLKGLDLIYRILSVPQ